MTQTAFSIAHLSDPHLSRPAPVRAGELCNKRILGYLSWLRRRRLAHQAGVLEQLVADLHRQAPDHTVVTGDFTHIGLPEEFRQVAEWLPRLGDPQQVTIIPGNHDSYVRAAWQDTYALWREYLAGDAADSWSVGDFPSVRVRGPVAILGISTAVPSPWFRASGRVGASQLRRLAGQFEELRDRPLFRLALIHHAPVPGVDRWRKRLDDVRETARVLAAGRAHLVLHGHDHRASWSSIPTPAGAIPVVAVPSASYGRSEPDKLARYHIYRLRRAGDAWQADVEIRGLRDGGVRELERRQLQLPAFD